MRRLKHERIQPTFIVRARHRYSGERKKNSGVGSMALKKVVLYFEDQQDALRFTLAAGSLISGEYSSMAGPLAKLTQPLSRAARITAGGSLGHESGGTSAESNSDASLAPVEGGSPEFAIAESA
jgi:hypothetical protein